MTEQLLHIEQPKTDNDKSNSDLICELYGLGAGWDVWGNQAPKSV
jgi:hypothetical protein